MASKISPTSLFKKATIAQRKLHEILATHEHASSRVIILEDLLMDLQGLPADVHGYFRESCSCLEFNLLRSAVVLSWAGFFHVFVECLMAHHEVALRAARPSWSFNDLSELKEGYVEHQILESGKTVSMITRQELRIYQGQLATRNQCAHPTLYKPTMNSALGFVDDMINQAIKFI
ncbi:MAG: hypothetical protein C4522_17905 [Desulfobacteraceae bacterium]|nr:MAG: hypothetical protein C4522_17905 [Desulfobacteraceae bacterium]